MSQEPIPIPDSYCVVLKIHSGRVRSSKISLFTLAYYDIEGYSSEVENMRAPMDRSTEIILAFLRQFFFSFLNNGRSVVLSGTI